ncbi:MAG: zinc-binding dehydrogenase [Chloroflexota bacterium]
MANTMQGVVFLGPQQLELRELDIPTPGPNEMVVKVERATTCGTDLKGYVRGHRLFREGMIFGHEFAGYVHAVGSNITKWKAGDAVVAANSAPCNVCFFCRRGRPQLCVEIEQRMNFGAYAEYILLPEHIALQNVHRVPPGLEWEYASFTEPLACSVLGINQVGIELGDTVAIIGAGAQALMQLQLAKASGAGKVILIGRSHGRLDAARELGADVVFSSLDHDPIEHVKELTEGYGADVVIESAGNPKTWEQALLMARKGGKVLQYSGLPGGTQVPFDATHLHYGEVTMMGSFHHTPRTIEQAVNLIGTGQVNVRPMLQGTIGLSDVEDGLLRMKRSEVIKLAVDPLMN